MFRIVRTVFGLVTGWVISAIMGLLGRYHSQGSLTVRPDRRQFVRNATLGAVGTVLTLGAAGFLGLLWPRKTGAFGSELTVKAEEVTADNARDIASKLASELDADMKPAAGGPVTVEVSRVKGGIK